MDLNTIDIVEAVYPDYELWMICRELDLLKTEADILYRQYRTLSHGERTKVMLAVLFSREGYFLLIDEPTNHLDMPTREVVRDYLNKKRGFILISHDREILDACIDHVLVLERSGIQVEKGNFSSWWENKNKRDGYEIAQNEKLKRDIRKLEDAAKRTAKWADKVEGTKIGFDPTKEHDRSVGTRAYIGEKSRKMQQRRKNLERRQQNAINEKGGLMKNIEQPVELKLLPLQHHKEVYIKAEDLSLAYGENEVLKNISLELKRGERLILQGKNGCGKSTLLKAILNADGVELLGHMPFISGGRQPQMQGRLEVAKGLKISYINQDTSWLKGDLSAHIKSMDVSESLFKSILRQLDFERVQFEKQMDEYSEGQKKKVLIAGSLLQQAHLYIWDEPLNYIDVFSRMQIEQLILKYQPTMLIVEHDKTFGEKCGTLLYNQFLV